MSINQEVLEDLAQTSGVDEETLKTVSPDPVVGTPERFVVDQPIMGTETPITDEVRSHLLNPASQLVTIRENMETTEDMGKIHEEIAGNAKISVDDASRAVTRFEGFERTFPLRSFTAQRSKVNFHLVDGFMKEALKVRQEQVCSQARFFKGAIEQAQESFDTYQSFYSTELIRLLTEFQAEVANWKADPQYLHKQIVYLGEELNVAECNPSEIIGTDATLGELYNKPLFKEFVKSVESYEEVRKRAFLASSIINTIQTQESVDDLINTDKRVNNYHRPFSCLDLVETMGSPYFVQFIHSFEKAVKESIKSFQELEESSGVNYSDFVKVRSFLVDNGDQFDKVTGYAHYYTETIDITRRLFLIATSFLDYFKQEK